MNILFNTLIYARHPQYIAPVSDVRLFHEIYNNGSDVKEELGNNKIDSPLEMQKLKFTTLYVTFIRIDARKIAARERLLFERIRYCYYV